MQYFPFKAANIHFQPRRDTPVLHLRNVLFYNNELLAGVFKTYHIAWTNQTGGDIDPLVDDGSLEMTATNVHEFRVFGLAEASNGRVFIQIGYRQRF